MIKVTTTPPMPTPPFDSSIMSLAERSPQISQPNPAKSTYKRLVIYIKKFEADLDNNHEIGALLASFGRDIKFRLTRVSYSDPDIITLYGIDEKENDVQLIQNISQLSILLIAMKKLRDKPRRIGFYTDKMQNEMK